MRVGVLALQGGFKEHLSMLKKLNVDGFEVRRKSDLDDGLDALIIPGGESTVIGKLLVSTHLLKPIKTLLDDGLPVFGTCAGMILLSSAKEIDESVRFGAIPITVQRNAFGRQLGSFSTNALFEGIGEIPMTFIRAPIISQASDQVTILSTVQGNAVAARYKQVLVSAFHPELTDDLSVHSYFIESVRQF